MRERRSAVPVLRDVQLARGLAAPRNPQPPRHHGPRHLLPPPRQELFAQRIQPQRLPQPPAQPYPAKGATPLHADPVQPHLRGRFPLRRRLEQLPLIPSPRDLSRQGLRPGAPLGVQLAELRHRLLHHLAVAPHRADEAPVDVRLAVLAANGVPQIHGHSPPHRRFSQIRLASCKGQGRHYTGFPEPAHTNPRTYRSSSLESALTFSEAEEVGLTPARASLLAERVLDAHRPGDVRAQPLVAVERELEVRAEDERGEDLELDPRGEVEEVLADLLLVRGPALHR